MSLLLYLIWTLITDPICQPVKFCFCTVKRMGTSQVLERWSRTLFFPSPFCWSQESCIWKRRHEKVKWVTKCSLFLLIYKPLIWRPLGSVSSMGSLFQICLVFFPYKRFPQAASCYSAQLAWFQSGLLYIRFLDSAKAVFGIICCWLKRILLK